MLTLENISTGYGKKQVLSDISIDVKKSEIVLLAGSNGSGKSTLLKAIFGLLPLWTPKGRIRFDGKDITGCPPHLLLNKGLLYIPQKNSLFEDLTVRENLEMAGLSLDKKVLRNRIDDTLTLFPTLRPYLSATPMKISGGERQLLTLAMATLHRPNMILYDEPFTGLSPQNIRLVSDQLTTVNRHRGIALLIVEHRVRESLEIAHRVIGLKLGELFSVTPVDKHFNIERLQPIFI